MSVGVRLGTFANPRIFLRSAVMRAAVRQVTVSLGVAQRGRCLLKFTVKRTIFYRVYHKIIGRMKSTRVMTDGGMFHASQGRGSIITPSG